MFFLRTLNFLLYRLINQIHGGIGCWMTFLQIPSFRSWMFIKTILRAVRVVLSLSILFHSTLFLGIDYPKSDWCVFVLANDSSLAAWNFACPKPWNLDKKRYPIKPFKMSAKKKTFKTPIKTFKRLQILKIGLMHFLHLFKHS